MPKFPIFVLAGALCLTTPIYAQAQAPAPNLVRTQSAPGVRREAGAWLFNDSVFVAPGDNSGLIGGPVFVPNLRRDKKNKLPLFMAAKTGQRVNFATLPLPTLPQISAPGFDFGVLQAQLVAQVNAARAAGQSYLGWSLPAGNSAAPLNRDAVAATLKTLRVALDSAAPDSALILQVEASENPALAVDVISAAAKACDAVVLLVQPKDRGALWPLKMARRVAEEQPDFDLPILVAPTAVPADKMAFDTQMLEFWMGGATGFVLSDAQIPAWANVISRNPGLWSGAVTLEDAAVLPSRNPRTLDLVTQLRAAGRVPLAGRLPGEGSDANSKGESVLAILDDQTSLETLGALDKAARAGNLIYLEGTPNLQNKAILEKMSDLTGTTLEVLPAPKSEVLTLSDPWLFGDARGREFGVTQRVKWTLKTSLAAQARKKKGEDVLEPFSAAKLASDENGILVAPLGKGRIVWLAHAPQMNRGDEGARRDYYAAITGNLQGALARLNPDSASPLTGTPAHLALRASKAGTPIIAIFNDGNVPTTFQLSARSDAPLALDLQTEKDVPATVVGYSSNVQVTVPAQSYAWLAFGASRVVLDKERLAARPKAKIK